MFLIDAITSQFSLVWGTATPKVHPLPPHIERTFVSTPGGEIELLVCQPKKSSNSSPQRLSTKSSSSSSSSSSRPPIFFAHGGCGNSSVWLEWMTYLHEQGYPAPTYAYSARCHGASYVLPYKTMVHGTSFEDILSDVAYSLDHIEKTQQQQSNTKTQAQQARAPILVGHSSGGGAIQALLSGRYKSKDPNLSLAGRKASGICLVGAIPSYGSYDMYWNWFKQDKWFPLRSIFHMGHPNSPLCTDELVHSAFFGQKFSMAQAGEFRRWMPDYESMEWPTAMLGETFGEWWSGKPTRWLSPQAIVGAIEGAAATAAAQDPTADASDKVCVLVGKEDMMYRENMWEKQCGLYREALKMIGGAGAGEAVDSGMGADSSEEPIEAVSMKREGGVRLVLVEDSGHHVQNDVHCNEAAEALMRWANQV